MPEINPAKKPEPIDVTGEVISPDHDNITPLFMRHMAAYRCFREYLKDKKVLEVGFGEGYGTYYLSEAAREITGIDVSLTLVEHAKGKYVRENLYFIKGDAVGLPFPENSFDVVVSSQVLEHVKDYMAFLRELRRVVRPGGTAIVATPNRMMMVDGVNPYHYKEFSAKELGKALGKVFPESQVFGLFGSDKYMALKTEEQGFAKRILALDFLRLRRFVPRPFIKPLYKKAFEAVNKRTEGMIKEAGEITVDDFSVSETCPEKGLDLIGICKKQVEK
ncbi:MAG TPA: class I SAM-dependent methyltransferase [Nitrospirota bacterium]|jgi:ubiquinone/menaquinone biosynthesis C-methylase UbiE